MHSSCHFEFFPLKSQYESSARYTNKKVESREGGFGRCSLRWVWPMITWWVPCGSLPTWPYETRWDLQSSAASQNVSHALCLSKRRGRRATPSSNTFSVDDSCSFSSNDTDTNRLYAEGGEDPTYLAAIQSRLVSVRLEHINWQARPVVSAKNSIPPPYPQGKTL